MKTALFCGFILYCQIMFRAYQMLEKLSTREFLDDVAIHDHLVTQIIQNVTTYSGVVTKPVYDALQIWPRNDSDTKERIVSQLQFAHAHRKSFTNTEWESLKFIYTDGILNRRYVGREAFTVDNCPINSCYLINGRRGGTNVQKGKSVYYDAILTSMNRVPNVTLKSNGVVIWFHLEAPLYGGAPQLGINWTATYRRSSTIRAPYEFFKTNKSLMFNDTDRNYANGKNKMAAIFMSNCRGKNNRSALVEELQKYISIHIYGRCGVHKCPRKDSNTCFGYLNKDYKFYLAFENSNCRDYITEKFFLNGLR
jgi:hypothetical protein